MAWWIRPLVRFIAALLLPVVVPGLIIMILWALPGDPASIICPPQLCPATEELARAWHLDQGPWHFFKIWISNAITGDLGRSWRVWQGREITAILLEEGYLRATTLLILLSFVPVVMATVLTVAGFIPQALDRVWNAIGLAPAVILALFVTAYLTINYGPAAFDVGDLTVRLFLGALLFSAGLPVAIKAAETISGFHIRALDKWWAPPAIGLVTFVVLWSGLWFTYGELAIEEWPATLRLILGALVLGLADGMLNGAIVGTRQVFEDETKQRYVQMAILRGEWELANALPNVLPALIGQLRARILLMISGAVIVEVVLNIAGVGSLLWDGTLLQDFGVVLAAAFVFAIFSSCLLVIQACSEIVLNMHIRRAPVVP